LQQFTPFVLLAFEYNEALCVVELSPCQAKNLTRAKAGCKCKPDEPFKIWVFGLSARHKQNAGLLWGQVSGERVGISQGEAGQRVEEFNTVICGVEVERSTKRTKLTVYCAIRHVLGSAVLDVLAKVSTFDRKYIGLVEKWR